jgi:ATP-dependent RNA helicase RhlE
LVATDIAARGIDVDLLSHVIIYDVPLEPESYVHRIGRTGRAQATGEAIMFCEPDELKYLQQVLKLIGKEIPLITDHPYHHKMSLTARPTSTPKEAKPDRGPRPSKVRYDRSPKDSGRSDDNSGRPLSRNDAPRRSDRNDKPKSNTANKPNNPSKSGRYY